MAFDAKSTLSVNGNDYAIYKLDAVTEGHVAKLPFSLKVLLETCCVMQIQAMSAMLISAHWPIGIRKPSPARKSRSRPHA